MQKPCSVRRFSSADIKTGVLALGLFVGATASDLASAENFIDLSAGVRHDDNLSRGFLDRDQYSDRSINLDMTAGYVAPLKPGRSVMAFTSLSASRFDKLSGFNSESASLGGRYLHKFGLGAYAPVVSATLGWTWHNSHGKTRDRHLTSLELGFSKRLSASLMTRLGSRYDNSEGVNDDRLNASVYSALNDIFDFEQFGLFAGADYTFTNHSTVSLHYSWMDGTTVSSALAPNPRLLGIARSLTLDPAVQAPPGRHQVAYALPTDAHLLSFNWSIPVDSDTSLNVGYSRHEIRANDNISYGNNQFSVTLLHVIQ